MTNINVTNFIKNIYKLLEQTIRYNEPSKISTKNGNVIIISEEDYNSMIETLYISSISKLKEKIIKGMSTPIEDCLSEEEIVLEPSQKIITF